MIAALSQKEANMSPSDDGELVRWKALTASVSRALRAERFDDAGALFRLTDPLR